MAIKQLSVAFTLHTNTCKILPEEKGDDRNSIAKWSPVIYNCYASGGMLESLHLGIIRVARSSS